MSKLSPDRRPYCDQTSVTNPTIWLGGCWNQTLTNSIAVPLKRNVTAVPNYATPATPPYIAPYGRGETRTAPCCSPYYTCGPGCDSLPYCGTCCNTIALNNGNPYCDRPLITEFAPGNPQSHSFSVGEYTNLYADTTESVNLSVPRAFGYKNVYASKMWLGRKGYASREIQQWDSFDWCCQCAHHNRDPQPDTRKYLRMSATSNIIQRRQTYAILATGAQTTCDCPPNCVDGSPLKDCEYNILLADDRTVTANANSTIHTDRWAGNMYIDSCYSASVVPTTYTNINADCTNNCGVCNNDCGCDCPTYTVTGTSTYNTCWIDDPDNPGEFIVDPNCVHSAHEYSAQAAWALLSKGNSDLTILASLYCSSQANMGIPDVIEGSGNSWHLEWKVGLQVQDSVCGTYHYEERLYKEVTITPTTYEEKTYGQDAGRSAVNHPCQIYNPPWIVRTHIVYTFSDTALHYTSDTNLNISYSFEGTDHQEMNCSLSDLNTPQMAYNDAVQLLSYWDMGDDELLPWRTDLNVNKGPWIHYDEYPMALTIGNCYPETSGSAAIFGKPAPRGIDRVWNPIHENYRVCNTSDGPCAQPGCESLYLHSYGAWSDATIGTPRATAWLDDRIANGMPQGAIAMVNQFDTTPGTCNSAGPHRVFDDNVWVGKYAEIIQPKNSINFARPCNEDRFQLSSSMERCIKTITDNVFTIEDYFGSAPGMGSGTKVWICGTGVADGLHQITVNSTYQFTSTKCLLSASATPFAPVQDCGSGIVCELRWAERVPGICGRVDIVSATATQPITCSLKEDCLLLDDDDIFIVNAVGGNINGHWKTKVLDSKNVVLVNSNGISASYQGSGQMYSAFSVDWRYNDHASKGEYTFITWSYDFREWGEWNRITSSKPWIENESQCNSVFFPTPTGCNQPPDYIPCDPYVPCVAPEAGPEPRPYNFQCGFDTAVTNIACGKDCLEENICSPRVAYFAPAGQDHFKGPSNNHGFGVIVADSQGWDYGGYVIGGSMWQGIIKQSIPDPFWEGQEKCPCEYDPDLDVKVCNTIMRMDDGTCQADQTGPNIDYYPMYPEVEALCTEPVGVPKLKGTTGHILGCANVDKFTQGSCPSNLCYPPWASTIDWNAGGPGAYKPHVYAAPWVTYLNKLNCVCAHGRFGEHYSKYDGILCDSAGCDGANFWVSPP